MVERTCWTCRHRIRLTRACGLGKRPSSARCERWERHGTVLPRLSEEEKKELLGQYQRKFSPSESGRGYYYCARCGAPVSRKEYEENHHRCPKCSSRIFLKPRRRVVRTVRAR